MAGKSASRSRLPEKIFGFPLPSLLNLNKAVRELRNLDSVCTCQSRQLVAGGSQHSLCPASNRIPRQTRAITTFGIVPLIMPHGGVAPSARPEKQGTNVPPGP